MHLRAQGLSKGDEHSTNTPHWGMVLFTFTVTTGGDSAEHIAPAVRGGHWQRLLMTYLTLTLTLRDDESSLDRIGGKSVILEFSCTDIRYATHTRSNTNK